MCKKEYIEFMTTKSQEQLHRDPKNIDRVTESQSAYVSMLQLLRAKFIDQRRAIYATIGGNRRQNR
jgi:hypothetical protein